MSAMLQQPTLPGKVGGIIGWDPLILRCRLISPSVQIALRHAAEGLRAANTT